MGTPIPLTLWPSNSPTYLEPGSSPDTVKEGKAEDKLAAKFNSPLSVDTLYTVSVKCCGSPPLKPG